MDKHKKALVVYSSRAATENSRKLAEAIAASLGDCEISTADDAPSPSKYAFVILGFGLYHGWPDGDMRAFMRKCHGQDIGLFMTLGAYPDSDHAITCLGRAEGLLESCRVRAKFICHGRLDPATVERMKARPQDDPQGWNPERAERIAKAESHPDADDIAKAATLFQDVWRKIREEGKERKTPGRKKAIVLAAFGTSSHTAKSAYKNIEMIVAKAYPGTELRWAFSSGMIRAKLRKQGIHTKAAAGVLNGLLLEGYDSIEVIPLYLTPGEEFHKLISDIAVFRNAAHGFKEIKVGRTLLSSADSLIALCKAVLSAVPKERSQDDAVVFMGHGHDDGRSDILYIATAGELAKLDRNTFVGCVEGKPDFDNVRSQLKAMGVRKAFLIPFMVVAGDHAINDMSGDEPESWKSILQADGIECQCLLKGLGECDEVVRIFLDGMAR